MPYPPIIILAGIMCGSAVIIAAMMTFSFYIAVRRRRASQAVPADEIARRLERIEQAVEATALEVERLGESNRFLTRLLTEKSATR